jgi:hypothetical protein
MIEQDKIMLLAQLTDSLAEAEQEFKIALDKKDKKRFDNSKAAVLDFHKKIKFLLNKK